MPQLTLPATPPPARPSTLARPSRILRGLPRRAALAALLVAPLMAGASRPAAAAEPTVASAAAGTSAPADWPQWRGPGREDRSADTGLLQTWPEKGPPLAWRAKGLGGGYSGVSVAGGKIFTMGDSADACLLIALDEKDGHALWTLKVATPNAPNDYTSYPGPRCTPTIDGDVVYALGPKGDLVCAKTADGTEVWRTNLAQNLGGKLMSIWGYTESPLVEGDKLLCCPGGPKGTVAAFDKASGKVLWRSTSLTDKASYASLIGVDLGGVRQAIVLTDAHVAGIAVDDGRVLWKADRRGGTAVIPTPVYRDGTIFVTSGYGAGCQLFHVTAAGQQYQVEPGFNTKEMSDHHGGVVLVGDYLYGSSDPGILKCLKFQTGEVAWKERSPGKGSITYADGRLYFRKEGGPGTVYLIEADPSGYKEAGHFNPPDRSDRNSWPHPVVCHGKLYLRDQDVLLCYNVKM